MNNDEKPCAESMPPEQPINKLAILFGRLLRNGYATAIEEEKIQVMKAWDADPQFAYSE